MGYTLFSKWQVMGKYDSDDIKKLENTTNIFF